MGYVKKQKQKHGNITQTPEYKQAAETSCKNIQILDVVDIISEKSL